MDSLIKTINRWKDENNGKSYVSSFYNNIMNVLTDIELVKDEQIDNDPNDINRIKSNYRLLYKDIEKLFNYSTKKDINFFKDLKNILNKYGINDIELPDDLDIVDSSEKESFYDKVNNFNENSGIIKFIDFFKINEGTFDQEEEDLTDIYHSYITGNFGKSKRIRSRSNNNSNNDSEKTGDRRKNPMLDYNLNLARLAGNTKDQDNIHKLLDPIEPSSDGQGRSDDDDDNGGGGRPPIKPIKPTPNTRKKAQKEEDNAQQVKSELAPDSNKAQDSNEAAPGPSTIDTNTYYNMLSNLKYLREILLTYDNITIEGEDSKYSKFSKKEKPDQGDVVILKKSGGMKSDLLYKITKLNKNGSIEYKRLGRILEEEELKGISVDDKTNIVTKNGKEFAVKIYKKYYKIVDSGIFSKEKIDKYIKDDRLEYNSNLNLDNINRAKEKFFNLLKDNEKRSEPYNIKSGEIKITSGKIRGKDYKYVLVSKKSNDEEFSKYERIIDKIYPLAKNLAIGTFVDEKYTYYYIFMDNRLDKDNILYAKRIRVYKGELDDAEKEEIKEKLVYDIDIDEDLSDMIVDFISDNIKESISKDEDELNPDKKLNLKVGNIYKFKNKKGVVHNVKLLSLDYDLRMGPDKKWLTDDDYKTKKLASDYASVLFPDENGEYTSKSNKIALPTSRLYESINLINDGIILNYKDFIFESFNDNSTFVIEKDKVTTAGNFKTIRRKIENLKNKSNKGLAVDVELIEGILYYKNKEVIISIFESIKEHLYGRYKNTMPAVEEILKESKLPTNLLSLSTSDILEILHSEKEKSTNIKIAKQNILKVMGEMLAIFIQTSSQFGKYNWVFDKTKFGVAFKNYNKTLEEIMKKIK